MQPFVVTGGSELQLLFLDSWSNFMLALSAMHPEEKQELATLIKEKMTTDTMCPEATALRDSIFSYMTHKCVPKKKPEEHTHNIDPAAS